MRGGALPLADARALGAAARRTGVLRSALAAALLLALAAAYLVVRGDDPGRALAGTPGGTVVVLDVSGSVGDGPQSALVRRTLAEEIRDAGPHGRVGLVLFSDTAFEALPPTAPARALERFRHFYLPVRPHGVSQAPAVPPPTAAYPPSPWALFVGGTAIASGLHEARLALARAGLEGGRVLLVSDLVDSPADARPLRRELAAYARDPRLDLQVRVLPATGASAFLGLFKRELGRAAVRPAHVPVAAPPAPGRPLPLLLMLAAAACAVVLATAELLAVPLRWGASAEAGA